MNRIYSFYKIAFLISRYNRKLPNIWKCDSYSSKKEIIGEWSQNDPDVDISRQGFQSNYYNYTKVCRDIHDQKKCKYKKSQAENYKL